MEDKSSEFCQVSQQAECSEYFQVPKHIGLWQLVLYFAGCFAHRLSIEADLVIFLSLQAYIERSAQNFSKSQSMSHYLSRGVAFQVPEHTWRLATRFAWYFAQNLFIGEDFGIFQSLQACLEGRAQNFSGFQSIPHVLPIEEEWILTWKCSVNLLVSSGKKSRRIG